MAGTVITPLTPAAFTQRIADLFPPNWCSDDAKQTGNVFGLLLSVGTELTNLMAEVQYTQKAALIGTETSPELDNASLDFYGGALPRPTGMADQPFSTLILSSLFQSAATRQAISAAIEKATGKAPRMVEPWNVLDTGARDSPISFRDVDTAANPMRNTNPGLRCQGFIDSIPPITATLGGQTLVARDTNGFRDANEYRLTIASVDTSSLYDTINAVKAEGITIWVRIANVAPVVPYPFTLGQFILNLSALQ